MQRLGPGERAKTLGCADDVGSTVEQDGSHLAQQVGFLLTKHVPRAVLDKLAGMMGYTFPDEETQKFEEYTRVSIRIIGIRSWQQLRDCRCSTMEGTDRWRMMFAASWTKRLISRQPF